MAIFRPRSGRDDLDLTSPTIIPQDDPRSPKSSTLERVFLAFNSIETQSAESVSPMDKPGPHPKSEAASKANKNMQIGLGLPSRVAFRRTLQLQRTSFRDTIRLSSFREEYPSSSIIVTEPLFTPYTSRVQSTKSSNEFLKPSDFILKDHFTISLRCPPFRRRPPPLHRAGLHLRKISGHRRLFV